MNNAKPDAAPSVQSGAAVARDAATWYAQQAIVYLESPAGRALLREHAHAVAAIVAKMREAHNIPLEVLHAPFTI